MSKHFLGLIGTSLTLLAACGGGGMPGGNDGGDAADSSVADGNTNDTPVGDTPVMDAVTTDTSDTAPPSDTPNPTDTSPSCAGMECGNWASALSGASSLRGAAGSTPDQALMNCVIQLHQSDCCGARRAYGFNHAARMQLCTAESSCTMMYPTSPGCTNTTITTDTGATTTNPGEVRLRVVNPMPCSFGTCYTCETFVCTMPACMSAPTIMPGQCG